jgi:hypothetical protein
MLAKYLQGATVGEEVRVDDAHIIHQITYWAQDPPGLDQYPRP